jgi:hypothetical protein
LSLGKNADYLAWFRVAAGLRFLIDRYTVTCHFEPSAARRYELDLSFGVLLTNLSRQTGGSGFVASKSAVFDADFHAIE